MGPDEPLLMLTHPSSLTRVWGQSKFPESLSRVFVLNSPRLFSGVWAMIKVAFSVLQVENGSRP